MGFTVEVGGLLGNCRSLRHVESLSERAWLVDEPHEQRPVRVPDTTLAHLLPRLDPTEAASPGVGRPVCGPPGPSLAA